jgi:predicted ATPase
MARMRQINADVAAKRLVRKIPVKKHYLTLQQAQESDAKAYEDSIAADRAALEEKERRLAIAMATMEAARRDAAERKLANMQGRVWDAEKEAPLPNKNEPEPAPASL